MGREHNAPVDGRSSPEFGGGWEGVQKTPGGLIYDHASLS